jgi:hypothetical protein
MASWLWVRSVTMEIRFSLAVSMVTQIIVIIACGCFRDAQRSKHQASRSKYVAN